MLPFPGGRDALTQKLLPVERGRVLLDLLGVMGMVDITIICCRKGALPICFSYARSVSGDDKWPCAPVIPKNLDKELGKLVLAGEKLGGT